MRIWFGAWKVRRLNRALTELIRQQKQTTDNPFTYLWITNCVLCSVVIVYLLCKGWRKKGQKRPSAGESKQQKRHRLYEEKVSEIRKQISIAKAEVDRSRKKTESSPREGEGTRRLCRRNVARYRYRFLSDIWRRRNSLSESWRRALGEARSWKKQGWSINN